MGKVWKRLDRFISHWKAGFLVAGGWLLVGMMALIFVDVIGRYAFNRPLPGVYEFTEDILMVAIVFLAIAAAEHVRVRVVIERLRGRARQIVELLDLLIPIGLIALMTWQTGVMAGFSWKTREATEAIIAYPIYPSRFIVALGLFLLLLILVASFVKTVKQGRANE